MSNNTTSLVIIFAVIGALGTAVFYMLMDALPASIETWGVVTLLGVFVWGVFAFIEKMLMALSDVFLPKVRYVSRLVDQESKTTPLSGLVFTSQLIFTMIRVLIVMGVVLMIMAWLSSTVKVPEGYEIRYFLKKEWRLELR